MLKKVSFFLMALFALNFGFGQTIVKQSFESSGDTWTPILFSVPPCETGGDVWNYKTSLSAGNITPTDGLQFWGILDLNGNCGGTSFESISLPNTNVSAYTSVVFKFDYKVIGFDSGDDIKYQLFYDNVAQPEVIVVNGSTNLNAGWTTESVNVPGTVTNVRVVISVKQNGSDWGGIDNVLLEGSPASGCSISTSGITSISCNDNSTINDASDDYYTFNLDPTGSSIGSNYTVSVSGGGSSSISPGSGNYGGPTSFTLNTGSAGNGDITLTITDGVDNSCTYIQTITDTGSCSSGAAITCISEDFEVAGQPAGWSNNGAYYNTSSAYSGTRKAGINGTNEWIQLPIATNPNTLSFWSRASGATSDFTVKVQYSTDASSWTDASSIIANGSNTGGITTTYQQYSINLNLTGNYYLRWFMSARSGGSIYIDDVLLTCGGTTPTPTITLSQSSISSGLSYVFSTGPSNPSINFDVTGSNLTTGILLNGLTNFEISTDDVAFSSSITIPLVSANGTTTIYVRLKSGLAINTYNETITASSTGATNKTIDLDGEVTPPTADVVITEIMYNTSGTDDEWIEICNISGSTQDISNYIIDVGGTTEFTFPASTTITDGNCIVVSLGSNGDGVFNPDCPISPIVYGIDEFTNDTNNLNNSADTITLYTSGGSTVVDSVTYDDGDEASTDGNGSSYHVTDASQPNSNTASNWEAVVGGSPGSNSTTSTCQFPEINVEGNVGTFPDIAGDGSNVPAGFNNTLFPSTEIGSSSIKTFRIQNLGGADLNISSITISGTHASDFSVSNSPSTTISAASNTILEITFSPTAINTRNAIVTINNDDSNEGAYTFNIQGNGICSAAVISVSSFDPVSGPVGTEVTINGSGFTGSSTVTINGVNIVESTFINSSQIVVVVPEVDYDGVFVISQGGCKTESSTFSIINNSGSCGLTDLIMTEIYDNNGGSLAYVEIYNGTGSTIDLNNYYIRRYGDPTDFANNIYTDYSFTPSLTTIADDEVLYGKMSNDTDVASPDFNYTTGAFAGINADDILHLYNGTTLIDVYEVPIGTGIGYTALRDLTTTGGNVSSNPSDWTHNLTESTSNLGLFPYSQSFNRPTVSNPIDITGCSATGSFSITATQGDGGALSYQWYYYNTTTNSWATVTNTAFPLTTVTGETSNTLDLGNFYYNYSGYQFYCLVIEAGVCSVASNAAQIKTETTIWNGTTWSPSAPTSTVNAILNGNYDNSSNGDINACNLTVSAGNTLTIADNSFTQVQYNVLVEGTVTVHTSGSLVQVENNGLYTHINAGTSSITKSTAPMNNWYEYTYWSSPVIGETVGDAFPNTNANRRFWYNAANYLDSTREVGNNNQTLPGQDDIDDNGDDWQIASGIMQSGWGYAATYSTSAPYPNVVGSAQFIGPFNTDTIDVTVYKNDSEPNDNNWNLVGNPYPCAISADTFLSVNSIVLDENVPVSPPVGGVSDGAIFLWSHDSPPSNSNNGNEAQNFLQADYAIINLASEVAGGDGITPNRYIPSGQSFFISYHHSAPGSGGTIKSNTITFNNSMRVTGNNDQFFRLSSENIDILKLNLESDNGVFNQLAVAYLENASDNYDGMQYDTPKNLGTGAFATIYTLIDNIDKRFAIQGKNSESLTIEEIIPVGFSTTIEEPTIYTLSLADFEGDFISSNTIYLKDNLLNIYHTLSESDYAFTSESGEFNDRFEIRFNNESLSITDYIINSNELEIIELANGSIKFQVNESLSISKIEILDLLGRRLYTVSGSSHEEIHFLTQLQQSAFIAKVSLSNGKTIIKKGFKRN